ncbi:MAG: AraC family ligand binding domain-containing protein, partial [Oscillospiraceae bacterium]|nr:AraC family ligand binding domain-containing protein [Oscillospiraceae bacterium]
MLKINENFRIDNISEIIFDRVFDKNFTFEGEAHDFWEIVFVVQGKIEVVENEKIYIMSDGDIIFHAPMEFHKICSAENTLPHVLNMSFTVEGALPPMVKNGIFNLNPEQKSEYTKLFRFVKNDLVENEHPAPFAI